MTYTLCLGNPESSPFDCGPSGKVFVPWTNTRDYFALLSMTKNILNNTDSWYQCYITVSSIFMSETK
jgi:hypothetical protein